MHNPNPPLTVSEWVKDTLWPTRYNPADPRPPSRPMTQTWRAKLDANKANALAAAYPNPYDHDAQVASLIGQGYRIEVQTSQATQLVKGHPVNHVLHLLLSVFTAGLWLPVWIVVAAASGERRKVVARTQGYR